MIERRQIITVLIGALAVCAISRADMAPLPLLDAGYRQPAEIRTPGELRAASLSSPWADFAGIADLDSLAVGFLPQPDAEAGQTSETRPAPILTDRQNSLTLCLYALLGLGLCRSAPLVKRLHFSYLPDWYHSAGPSQIGHSFAISPDCLPFTPVMCFLQPDLTAGAQRVVPQYRRETTVSLWRKSQFHPSVLTSRGPPRGIITTILP